MGIPSIQHPEWSLRERVLRICLYTFNHCLFGLSAFRIHVSPFTKEVLDELGGYHLDLRGKVELKGKGIVDSYWLTGKDGFLKPIPVAPPVDS